MVSDFATPLDTFFHLPPRPTMDLELILVIISVAFLLTLGFATLVIYVGNVIIKREIDKLSARINDDAKTKSKSTIVSTSE